MVLIAMVSMARPLRIEYPGGVYHVTSRGNERRSIFKDDQDRERFLTILASVNRRYHWLCHSYCLMGNHYHLVIETLDGTLAKGMRQLNGVYTQSYNRRHRRVGHLLQGRYKAIVVDKDSHLLECCRYVVLNPVRAKMSKKAEDWAWSSYRGTVGLGPVRSCLTTKWILEQFSDKRAQAVNRYREFVREGLQAQSIHNEVRGQVLLGSDGFVEKLLPQVRERQSREIPRRERHAGRPALKAVLRADGPGERVEQVRTAVEIHGYSQREVADHLGVHYSTISRWMNR